MINNHPILVIFAGELPVPFIEQEIEVPC